MIFSDIKTQKTSIIVLAGDLKGYSVSYDKGNEYLTTEFIKRFYIYVSNLIQAFRGELIKFTGDGFYAVWELTGDNHHYLSNLINELSIRLSYIIRITKLDLEIDNKLSLRQSIVVDNNAIKITFINGLFKSYDYIGKNINFAFRIQSLANIFPYIVYHKDYLDMLTDTKQDKYIKYEVNANEISNLFKNANSETDKIFMQKQRVSEATINNIIDKTKDIIKNKETNFMLKAEVIEKEFTIETGHSPFSENNPYAKNFMNNLYKKYNWIHKIDMFFWLYIKTWASYLWELKNSKK